MRFENQFAYYVKNETRSKTNLKKFNLLDGDFIFESTFKLDSISKNFSFSEYNEFCVVGRMGFNMGIYAQSTDAVKWCWWEQENGKLIYQDIYVYPVDNFQRCKIKVIKKSNVFYLYYNDEFYGKKEINNLYDYSEKIICVGVGNPYDEVSPYWFLGDIYEVKIYHSSVETDENLYLWFDFEKNSQFKTFDKSGNGNHGEIVNTFKNPVLQTKIIQNISDELSEWRDKYLNSISKSFCAAKWYNASLHLGHGYTNSCHLPLPHPIDLVEIRKNPAALHNTEHKKKMRQMMLEGKRPAECSYCWKIEDIGRNDISDRIYKSRIYTEEDITNIKKLGATEDVLLKTVEVSFDRKCNFACSYCNAGYSTTWSNDIKKNGAYQKFKTTSAGAYYSDGSWAEAFGEDNPYVEAFLKWWPDLSQSLDEIRITGGEPLVSKNFWNFIENVKQYPSDKLRLAVNSNLGISKKLLDKLIEVSHELPIKEFDLYTSNESYGAHAEYIRDGLVYETWKNNMIRFIENAKFRSLTIMMTINSLCLFSITEFLDDMLILKEKYGENRPNLDFNILRWPAFMSPLTLPDDIKIKLHQKLKIWYDGNRDNKFFSVFEKSQIERLLDYIEIVKTGHHTTEYDNQLQYHDFKSFYEQYDKRRGKDFRKTFPELVEWYDSIVVDQTIKDVEITDGKITHYEDGEYNR